jgi:hypothetical protein
VIIVRASWRAFPAMLPVPIIHPLAGEFFPVDLQIAAQDIFFHFPISAIVIRVFIKLF